MTAFSYSLNIDNSDQQPDAITVSTLAPNAGDVELRVSRTNTPTRHQIELIIKAFERRLRGLYGSSDVLNI